MDDIKNLDLYELIGVSSTASLNDVKKAYRKKALSCHPDKHPDKPDAVLLFHQLSKALEILTDESARKAYDKVFNARQQAKLRTREFDSKRKKLIEDLEAREELHRRSQSREFDTKSDEEKLQAEIERLRKEGAKLVQEEVALVRQRIQEELRKEQMHDDQLYNSPIRRRIKIKWKVGRNELDNGGYDYDTLYKILSKYGDIAVLVVSPNKKGRALVEYENGKSAELAVKTEIGFSLNPLKLERLWKSEENVKYHTINKSSSMRDNEILFPNTEESTDTKSCIFPSYSSSTNTLNTQSTTSYTEFENSVLSNLRRIQERKRLMEQLKTEETDT